MVDESTVYRRSPSGLIHASPGPMRLSLPGHPATALLLVALSASAAVAQPVNIPGGSADLLRGWCERPRQSRQQRRTVQARCGVTAARSGSSTGHRGADRGKKLATWPGRLDPVAARAVPRPRRQELHDSNRTARTTPIAHSFPVTWDLPTRIFTLSAAYLSDSLRVLGAEAARTDRVPAWDQKQLTDYSQIATVGTAACVRDDHYYDAITTTYQCTRGPARYVPGERAPLGAPPSPRPGLSLGREHRASALPRRLCEQHPLYVSAGPHSGLLHVRRRGGPPRLRPRRRQLLHAARGRAGTTRRRTRAGSGPSARRHSR